jgi:putative lipoic acid-binding regulatory protein
MIEFPCTFPLKIIFQNEPGASSELLAIVRHHYPDIQEDAIQLQLSQNGKFASITATVQAQSQSTLDALYSELNQHAHIKMVL